MNVAMSIPLFLVVAGAYDSLVRSAESARRKPRKGRPATIAGESLRTRNIGTNGLTAEGDACTPLD
jgi:hypothetical protein